MEIETINDINCEIFGCKNPVVAGINDMFEKIDWETGMIVMSLNGNTHYFCKKHKRGSITTDISESPLFMGLRRK